MVLTVLVLVFSLPEARIKRPTEPSFKMLLKSRFASLLWVTSPPLLLSAIATKPLIGSNDAERIWNEYNCELSFKRTFERRKNWLPWPLGEDEGNVTQSVSVMGHSLLFFYQISKNFLHKQSLEFSNFLKFSFY